MGRTGTGRAGWQRWLTGGVLGAALTAGPLLGATPSAASNATAVAYSIEDIGQFNGTAVRGDSYGFGINNAGQVTGMTILTDPSTGVQTIHAFRWTGGSGLHGTLADLGNLGPCDSAGSRGLGINDDGEVVGYSNPSCAEYDKHGFLYTSGPMADIGSLGGITTIANAINTSGVFTGISQNGNGVSTAFEASSPDELVSLNTLAPLPPDGTNGTPAIDMEQGYGINAAGQIAGIDYFSSSNCGGSNHPFRWTPDQVVEDLGTLVTEPVHNCAVGGGQGLGINASGVVVGEASSPTGFPHAFRYVSSMQDLGTLAGDAISTADGVNSTGVAVGFSQAGTYSYPVAVLFPSGGGSPVDLNSLIDPSLGWSLNQAYGINDAGQIVGYGTHAGHTRAFRMTPIRLDPSPSGAHPYATAEFTRTGSGLLTANLDGPGGTNITVTGSGGSGGSLILAVYLSNPSNTPFPDSTTEPFFRIIPTDPAAFDAPDVPLSFTTHTNVGKQAYALDTTTWTLVPGQSVVGDPDVSGPLFTLNPDGDLLITAPFQNSGGPGGNSGGGYPSATPEADSLLLLATGLLGLGGYARMRFMARRDRAYPPHG